VHLAVIFVFNIIYQN